MYKICYLQLVISNINFKSFQNKITYEVCYLRLVISNIKLTKEVGNVYF